ncbi:MAG: nucleoside deaminase [Chitinophagales bacterium]|jgi:tRNA(adenine34) deaminase|nr:nucleoside deaminase [Chitinophagales bacterium]
MNPEEFHVYAMNQALREAQRAFEADEVPIGCVITLDQQIIARGHNQTQTLNDATAHAEIIALTAAYNHLQSRHLDEASMYITIEPCAMCAGALKWSKIKALYIGAKEPKSGYSLYEPSILHPKTEVSFGIMAQEASALMQHFFLMKRKS